MKRTYPKKVGKCRHCGKDIIAKSSSYASVGRRTRIYCSGSCRMTYKNLHDNPAWRPEVKAKIGSNTAKKLKGFKHPPEQCILRRLNNLGEKSHFWKGGKTKQEKIIRTSAAYKKWRTEIFKRDGYICQHCGKRGGYLHADHINPFANYPELRFDINNGRTLCVTCHQQTENYPAGLRKANVPMPKLHHEVI